MNRDGRRRAHSVKLITGGWDDATNAIADWDLALLPVSRRSESSRHPLAVKSRVTAKPEVIPHPDRIGPVKRDYRNVATGATNRYRERLIRDRVRR